MNENALPPSSIQRSFRDLSAAEVADIEKASVLARAGWGGSFGWDEVLRSDRILIVSEAGAGKTYECQAQRDRLWKSGEPAFFLDLATLAGSSVREMFSQEEEERFEAWLRSQSDVATFFLDSIDELKLTLDKFDLALKRLNKALGGQLGRAHEVRTSLTQGRIARVLFCEHEGKMVLLHAFIKKTQKTPAGDLELAMKRKKEIA
jgi:phage-related protein